MKKTLNDKEAYEMAILLTFAFISGVITILSPCILPVLPIVLSGSVGHGRGRPFGVLAGFVVTFTTFTLALTAIVQALGETLGVFWIASCEQLDIDCHHQGIPTARSDRFSVSTASAF